MWFAELKNLLSYVCSSLMFKRRFALIGWMCRANYSVYDMPHKTLIALIARCTVFEKPVLRNLMFN